MATYTEPNFYSVSLCRANPNVIFVYGDNMIGKGTAGQATIRNCPNSFGIPTKRLPSMKDGSFFNDSPDEFNAVFQALNRLFQLSQTHDIVFPAKGIGTGLARMNQHSPKLYTYMIETLASSFGFNQQ